jgi:hypothetical protein
MAKKPPATKRKRTERRAAERVGVKLARAGIELASLEAGGSAARPIDVTSASIVEPHAAGLACVACGSSSRVEEHAAINAADSEGVARSLRVARVRCSRCGFAREIYFRIAPPLAN